MGWKRGRLIGKEERRGTGEGNESRRGKNAVV